MSYLYDKLKEALGGSKLTDSKSTVINDWSPNSIRVIIISRDAIITVNHLGVFGGCTKKVDLDVTLVARDLDEISRTNYGKPKLNGLLTKRSFSCLEEIYVDSMFMNYPRVFDLVSYVKDSLNANSRLRYFGYGDFCVEGLREYLNTVFKEAYSKKDYGYSFAKDTNRPCKVEYKETGNIEWYRKYYLRPQYYRKDREGGDLDIHFKKIANGYVEYLNKKCSEAHSEKYWDDVRLVIGKDTQNKVYFNKVDKLLSYLHESKDDVAKIVFDCVKLVLLRPRKIDGLTYNVLHQSGSITEKYILNCYERYRVLDSSKENSLNVEKYLDGIDGFIPIGVVLDEMCLEITKGVLAKGYKDLVAMALVCNKNIPDGKFSEKYLNKMERSKDGGSYQGYIDYIEEIIGVEV